MISQLPTNGNWPELLSFWLKIGSYLGAAYLIAIVVYRVVFHPLAKYPGPFLAKITNLDNVYHAYKSERHTNFLKCHEKYGPVYRYGPNQLSFNSAVALHDIYSAKSNVQKAKFYNAFPPGLPSTFNTIDKHTHGIKRRTLSQAFSDKALKCMEEYILLNVDKWHRAIKAAAGRESLNMSTLSTYLTFDVMGELAFGRSFDMIGSNKNRFISRFMIDSGNYSYMNGVAPTITKFGLLKFLLPSGGVQNRHAFRAYADQQAVERVKLGNTTGRKDFFHYLIDAKDPETGKGLEKKDFSGESGLLIIAGSDTTSTALAGTFFYLLHNPIVLERVTKEVREAFKDATVEDIKTGPKLSSCHYLRACLDETLRIAPPVPSSLPREVCAGGAVIDGHQIPAGTEVNVSPYAIHRNPEYYSSPLTYRPERWLSDEHWEGGVSKSDLAKAQSAFCPFSIGPRACIGRSMAYMEATIAMARILFSFDPQLDGKLSESKDGTMWEFGDCFIIRKDGPMVKFYERKQS